ncbi:MAG: hypothetical protein A2725_00900 [Candidatus Magasanikbacteria bacterium RIFCSPHIGHO2_01_FULL_33_34]|uniref:Uncharacterized protein n=1 Tax=Candidatus Magasanikbacteria bacterium RIFCSPHIGHO2_01_FULL_33_34 TaxID=1798671 RepID=A0A1F6LIY7_9BACT|nr:MAG: hypothetical protein A2725_00900 [Candidatus Magasanikbacteria bacterium RIFCSPHIGHO2_01_FULL_33_34]OGH65314.1 MAG: hypothetical protein A3B83_04560 [Candidatus Magasanikbacteria bacterium RIFCSPHIGHO2_02_FULL_33_17]OGH76091.1 MAG: hypothetical protein A3A89_01485 [Candidatus Magasanikbacteria bacterium RIFCSPLOWO2_01_FULL_33_34]OGH81737.1 MAG: hypothetical protein A3F93_00670 [Candidatus Magasanikbacteria bacterium RIFCSPLOWO2_12_FULL_34_7]
MSKLDSIREINTDFKNDKPINFEEFNFSDIMWKNISDKRNTAEIKMIIDNKTYNCKLVNNRDNRAIRISFDLFDDENELDHILWGDINFDADTNNPDSEVNVRISREKITNENDKKNSLPAGTGIILYQKILDYIKEEAKQYKKGLLHRVIHEPSLGLDPQKWNKIFEPLLTEKGYKKITDGEWEHLYEGTDDKS